MLRGRPSEMGPAGGLSEAGLGVVARDIRDLITLRGPPDIPGLPAETWDIHDRRELVGGQVCARRADLEMLALQLGTQIGFR